MKFSVLATIISATKLLPAWADVVAVHLDSDSKLSDIHVTYDQLLRTEQNEIAPDTKFPVDPGSFSTCDTTGLLRQTVRVMARSSVICSDVDSDQYFTFPQKYARCYSLADEGCTGARVINSVNFAVRRNYSVDNEPIDLRINIYKDSGCLTNNPTTGGELIASVDTPLASDIDYSRSLKTVEICSGIEILPSEAIRVEIEQVEDGLDRFSFFPGYARNKEASGPSFLSTPDCIGSEFVDLADIGFRGYDLILEVQTTPAPAGEAYLPANYWVPPLDKPGMTCENVRLKISDHGEFTCLPIGEGICRDNGGNFGEWRFGIEKVKAPPCELSGSCQASVDTSTFPVLIDPANTRYPITGPTFTDSKTGEVCTYGDGQAIRGCNYAGTTHICISENIESDPNRYSNERPYMFFYNEKTQMFLYQLVCDGIGEEGKLPQLKMVNQEDLADATYVKYPVDIVKFKKGATPNKEDGNELWKMYVDWDGFEDPDTRRVGKLASFIGVTHPNLCKEYVSATSKACWKKDENCDDGSVNTPAAYERDSCEMF